jgi:hypothetical protein
MSNYRNLDTFSKFVPKFQKVSGRFSKKNILILKCSIFNSDMYGFFFPTGIYHTCLVLCLTIIFNYLLLISNLLYQMNVLKKILNDTSYLVLIELLNV